MALTMKTTATRKILEARTQSEKNIILLHHKYKYNNNTIANYYNNCQPKISITHRNRPERYRPHLGVVHCGDEVSDWIG